MKPILPFSQWRIGGHIQVSKLKLSIVNDNLVDSATFCFELMADNAPVPGVEEWVPVHVGTVVISGQDYENWGSSGDINADAFQIVASKIGVTLL